MGRKPRSKLLVLSLTINAILVCWFLVHQIGSKNERKSSNHNLRSSINTHSEAFKLVDYQLGNDGEIKNTKLNHTQLNKGGMNMNECIFDDLPVLYINMEKYIERNAWIKTVFKSCNLQRIEASVGTDMNKLFERINFDNSSLAKLKKDTFYETWRLFKALPGQLGNFVSHLDAVQAAFRSGAKNAVTLEDDASPVWGPGGGGKMRDLVALMDLEYPGWHSVRLQWNDYDFKLAEAKSLWLENGTPPVIPWKIGWGNVATLWSRSGMQNLLELHDPGFAHTETGNYTDTPTLTRWKCNPELNCSADLTFWPEGGVNTFVATPPLLTYRLAEAQTAEIRLGMKKSDHRLLHLRSAYAAIQWTLEASELKLPGGSIASLPFDLDINVTQRLYPLRLPL